jgi:hypothetical protein
MIFAISLRVFHAFDFRRQLLLIFAARRRALFAASEHALPLLPLACRLSIRMSAFHVFFTIYYFAFATPDITPPYFRQLLLQPPPPIAAVFTYAADAAID